jgi:hypothetical protein
MSVELNSEAEEISNSKRSADQNFKFQIYVETVRRTFQRASPVSEISEVQIERFTRSRKLKGRSNSSFCQNLSKSRIDRFPLNFVIFVIGANQLQEHVLILKTQIINGRLIRISNLRRDR